jgi:hypothetical protein
MSGCHYRMLLQKPARVSNCYPGLLCGSLLRIAADRRHHPAMLAKGAAPQ